MERSEASDYLKKAPQASFETQDYESWQAWNTCPDGVESCPRCRIDYATYLAFKEILDATP